MARSDPSSGSVYYFFVDQVGSTRIVTQANGTVCFDQDYFPYGQEVYTSGQSCPQSYKFTGYERDAETGLDYAFARYYNARLARFMSVDPLAGGVGDPQSLNRYAYVLNNPSNFIDPTGKACVTGSDGVIRCTATGSAGGPVYTGGGGGSPFPIDSEDCWGGCKPAWEDQKKPKPRETKGVGQVLSCAADTADALSIASVLNIDQNAHPVLGVLADAALGNTFSGVVKVGQSFGRGKDNLAAGADALGQAVLGGATLGVPIPQRLGGRLGPLHGGVVGAAMDATIDMVAPSLEGVALVGGRTAAGVFGIGKLVLDGAIFLGAMASCAAQ